MNNYLFLNMQFLNFHYIIKGVNYLEYFDNTKLIDINDITLFVFIFTVPNFINNVCIKK